MSPSSKGSALVTGASGFIGSRLLSTLLADGVATRVLVRHGLKPAGDRVAAYGVSLGDVTLPETLPQAVGGCDVVYHLAAGGGPLDEARAVNVVGTENLIRAAAQAGVRRFVHVSSVAVHGRRLPRLAEETLPLVTEGDSYSVSKAEGEAVALGLGRSLGVEVVVLRPTLVYGSGSTTWTLDYLHRIRYSQIALVGHGDGVSNLVHVDDMVRALRLAAHADTAVGEAFFVNGPGITRWSEYLRDLAELVGRSHLPSVSAARGRMMYELGSWHFRFTRRPPAVTADDLFFMTQRTVFSTEKARALLGFEPTIDLKAGVSNVGQELRATGSFLECGPRDWQPPSAEGGHSPRLVLLLRVDHRQRARTPMQRARCDPRARLRAGQRGPGRGRQAGAARPARGCHFRARPAEGPERPSVRRSGPTCHASF